MKLLLLGSTGLLGQAVCAEASARGWNVCGTARSDADCVLDIAHEAALQDMLSERKPDLVCNCAGLVEVQHCEDDPGLAYRVNARPLAILADWSRQTGHPLLHASTDHFFPEGGRHAHTEAEPVRLINEYARSKFAGEAFALTAPAALVLRTSIVGIRGRGAASFAEWAIESLLTKRPMTLFSDAWTSSIDVRSFAAAALDLVSIKARGLLNLAAGEPFSKEMFIRELGRQLGQELTFPTIGSVTELTPRRPGSLGLDVTRAEVKLGYKLPRLPEIVAAVLKQYSERASA